MLAALINCGACLIGGLIGLLLKKIIKRDTCDGMLKAVGLVVIVVGVEGCIKPLLNESNNTTELILLLVITLVVGTGIGSAIDIDFNIDKDCRKIEKKLIRTSEEGSFSKGFVTSSLIFCTGAMAIVGGIASAMGEPQTYYIKSLIDGVIAIALGATLGIGVSFGSIPVLIYQGLIVLIGQWLAKVMPESFTDGFSVVGYTIVMGVGANFLLPEEKRIKIGNMCPALILVILYYAIFK